MSDPSVDLGQVTGGVTKSRAVSLSVAFALTFCLTKQPFMLTVLAINS